MAAVPQELVSGVDFVSIPTKDLDRAVEFYGEKLGLHPSTYNPERGFAEFETGNLTLGLINPERMGMEHHVSHNAIALHVDDIEAARAALEASGVTFEDQPRPSRPSQPQMICQLKYETLH